ncbi:MAG TPA: hypothetical protein VE944_22070, partial [Nostoc sp.]|nr:hypothetical protein [Nostoc sp.]
MYKPTSIVLSVVLLGCFSLTIPSVVQAQVLVAQSKNPELKQLLEEGRRLVDTGDYGGAIAVYQRAARLDPK